MTDLAHSALIALRRLSDNWDSYGGKAVTEEVLAALETLHISPCHDGGVQVEIHAHGWDTELRFGPDGRPTSISIDQDMTTRPPAKRRRWPFKRGL